MITDTIKKCQLKDISDNFLICLTLAEDKRFFKHNGVDYISIIRALWKTINWELQGASTIEQQLVRTVTKQYQISIMRKIKESLLAINISRTFHKNQIMLTYLSVAYFGEKIFGLEAICRKLNINIKTASINECIKIISRLKYPNIEEKIYKRSVFLKKRLNTYYKSTAKIP